MLSFIALWSFRNISEGLETQSKAVDSLARREETKRLIQNRVLWPITLIKGLRGMALFAFLTFLPLYLANDVGLSAFVRAAYIGLLIAIRIVAKPVAGYLSDKLGRKQILAPGLLWSGAITLRLIFFGEGVVLPVLIALLGLFVYPDQPILTAAFLDLVDDGVVSTALGIASFVGFLLSALSPMVVGAVYEFVGASAALYYIGSLFFVAAILLVPLKLTRPDTVAV
ncbi:MAG TPA: MFS transporter [Dehalococcoidia bacterium]|nr:MFS transporter [Dehalococcoidia bacterium]